MSRRKFVVVALCAGLIGGCGGNEGSSMEEERIDLEQLDTKADIPSWIRHIPVNWGCDQTLSGKFAGWDSAHMYSFPGKVGYEYTFVFKATYPEALGAAVAVYDSESGKRVALKRNRWDNEATVVYRAEKSIKYLVAVYSIIPWAAGSYTLFAGCKIVEVTCQGDFACKQGEFCKMPEGKCAGGTLGVCTPKPEFCTEQYAPVCGCDGSTYGNACFADGAGVSLSYQGECKKPKVTVTTDKKGYLAGSPIKVELANGSSASVFLGGCSAFAWQTQENGKWVDKGPDHICVWEGIAKEVKAGTSHSESLQRDQGTWRVVAGYSVGCAPGKPLSQAGCKASYTAYSAAFKVKSCPMLNMPNPSAFCPDGRMVPNYDADGICITSYSCRPCEVADCGPQLGMPNKLCSDGQTMSGPSGKCIATGWGSCKWEVIECPKCQVTGCSGQICADQEVITTCEYMPWYGCYKQSECGAFGANGGCAWKQTPAFVACMASYGR